ncbi:hypothetical protein GUITHDRAFT_106915 [Guillardia theta CCMP2712]|uniref:Hexosyltransferase n=1 Tax=Guillardia theta (strain CCMP2712) TaxID=905079 RepID=L1JHA0_GUITC|nr:hypothetical protein GUITHDRAFT_106915 [Guillardia theta CCMP2712]EKX47475.1 hypothetical protein GUITHDRAFT_106915 [Guillardia theta CCMP2712]|eukprot:XP_005834455.1 hypothetical protein GUITHDRAFT_106915 [Guillardia theta CCMP2712]
MPPFSNQTAMELQGSVDSMDVSAMRKENRYAYVTLLTRDPYLPGVCALLYSLKQVNTKYPVICVVTKDVTQKAREEIELFGGVVREVEKFLPFPEDQANNYANALWIDCWTKLEFWEFTEYKKCVYLDADMKVYKNLDHLFEMEGDFLAAQDCYHGGDPEDRVRNHFHDPEKCFYSSSCPDKIRPYFNAGFFVFTPSKDIAKDMKQKAIDKDVTTFTFAEQDFMNDYFQGQWEPRVLPYTYNCIKWFARYHMGKPYNKDDIHVLHYVSEKPWVTGRIDPKDEKAIKSGLCHCAEQYDDWHDMWEEAMQAKANNTLGGTIGADKLVSIPKAQPMVTESAVPVGRIG